MKLTNQSGHTLTEVMMVMSCLAILSVGTAITSFFKTDKTAADFRSDVKSVQSFLSNSSKRAYLSGLCTTAKRINSRLIVVNSWKVADPGCTENFSNEEGSSNALDLLVGQVEIGMFIDEDAFQIDTLVFNQSGGTVSDSNKKIKLSGPVEKGSDARRPLKTFP